VRILFFGTFDARRHPRVRVVQQGLASLGEEVLECNVPLGLDTSLRLRMLERPWLAPLLGLRLLSTWRRLCRRSRRVPHVDAVIVGYMGHFDVHLARRLWKDVPIALDHLLSARDTALDRGVSFGPVLWLLGGLDRRALRAADIPVVDTEEHLDMLPVAERGRAVVVPVGAPSEWFRAPGPPIGPPLRVVFYGLFTPLQGAPTIGDAIRLLAREPIRFTMVGQGQELSATKAKAQGNPSVTWLDWVEPETLPSVAAGHDVCLGIFGTGPKAMRVVPNKVFQGAAAGCAIVTSDTAPQRRALRDAAVFVPPGDPSALADVLRKLANESDMLQELRRAAYQRADEAFRPAVVAGSLRERLVARALA
jgi:glycosyltransferase involved in cell wall biosynthesis